MMTSREADSPRDVTRLQNAAAAGGVLGAVAASSCCMLPLLLFTLGASGPWIGTLVRLAPYQPYFIAVAVACLGCGYWLLSWKRYFTAHRRRAADRLHPTFRYL